MLNLSVVFKEPKARWKRLDQKPDARIYVPPKREASAPKPPATALPLANGRPHSNSKDPTGAGLHRCERCARSFINPRALDHHNRDKHSQMTEPVSRDKVKSYRFRKILMCFVISWSAGATSNSRPFSLVFLDAPYFRP